MLNSRTPSASPKIQTTFSTAKLRLKRPNSLSMGSIHFMWKTRAYSTYKRPSILMMESQRRWFSGILRPLPSLDMDSASRPFPVDYWRTLYGRCSAHCMTSWWKNSWEAEFPPPVSCNVPSTTEKLIWLKLPWPFIYLVLISRSILNAHPYKPAFTFKITKVIQGRDDLETPVSKEMLFGGAGVSCLHYKYLVTGSKLTTYCDSIVSLSVTSRLNRSSSWLSPTLS